MRVSSGSRLLALSVRKSFREINAKYERKTVYCIRYTTDDASVVRVNLL